MSYFNSNIRGMNTREKIEVEEPDRRVQALISSDPVYRTFCELPIVSELRSRDRMRLFSCFEAIQFFDGNEIYRAGNKSEQRIYMILQGHVSINCSGSIYTTLRKGDVFGLFSFLDDRRPHAGTVKAESDLMVLTFDKKYFNELVFKEPVLGNQMLQFLFRLLSHMALKLESEYVAMHTLFSTHR